jgi:hypothetical protein
MATKTNTKAKAPAKAKATPKAKAASAKAAPAKKAATPKEPALRTRKEAMGERRGRPARFAGKTLTAIVEANPRRKNTSGHKSMSIIIANPGITFEDFVRKGGRSGDLNWDVEHEHVVVK